jgi:phasin family protein
MYDDILSKASERLNELLAPSRKFNALLVDNLDKFAKFQLESARVYTDLALEQLRAALQVSDADSLQTFVSSQRKIAEEVSKKLASDAETVASLSKDFTAEVQKLAQENVAVLALFTPAKTAAAPKAAPARKTA